MNKAFDIMSAVLLHLNGWRLDKRDKLETILLGQQGAKIRVNYRTNYRLEFYCVFPSGRLDRTWGSLADWELTTEDGQSLNINIDSRKPPRVIAREMERRLFARYLPLYQQCLHLKAQKQKALEDTDHLVMLLASLLSARRSDDKQNYYMSFGNVERGSGDLKLSRYNREVDLKLRWLPVDVALKIACVLKESILQPAQPDTNESEE